MLLLSLGGGVYDIGAFLLLCFVGAAEFKFRILLLLFVLFLGYWGFGALGCTPKGAGLRKGPKVQDTVIGTLRGVGGLDPHNKDLVRPI